MTRNRSWNRNRSRNRNRIQIKRRNRNRNRLQIFRFRNPAYDIKIGQIITTLEDKEKLQAEIYALNTGAMTWGMEFNLPKCKVMHASRTNPKI